MQSKLDSWRKFNITQRFFFLWYFTFSRYKTAADCSDGDEWQPKAPKLALKKKGEEKPLALSTTARCADSHAAEFSASAGHGAEGSCRMASWRWGGRFQCKGLEVSIYSWNNVAASIMWCLCSCLPMTHTVKVQLFEVGLGQKPTAMAEVLLITEKVSALSAARLLSFSHSVCGNICVWKHSQMKREENTTLG